VDAAALGIFRCTTNGAKNLKNRLSEIQQNCYTSCMKNKKLVRVYLASPYSHKDVRVVEARYGEAILAAAALQMDYPTHNIFSPIVNSHPLATATAA
jgi:hypothetical protein